MKFSLFWSHLNVIEYADFFRSESYLGRILRRLLEDSQKTLERLLGKTSNVFYARRLPAKSWEVFRSLLPKVVQRNDVKWSQAYLCWGTIFSSMCNTFVYGLFYDLYVYYFSCEFICKLEEMLIKRIWYICSCFSQSTWHYWSYWYNIPRNFLKHPTHS